CGARTGAARCIARSVGHCARTGELHDARVADRQQFAACNRRGHRSATKAAGSARRNVQLLSSRSLLLRQPRAWILRQVDGEISHVQHEARGEDLTMSKIFEALQRAQNQATLTADLPEITA